MMTEFGLDDLDELGEYICESSRQAVLAEIAKLPAGEYRNSMRVDGYEGPVDLVAKLDISAGGITVDYDGTSPKSNHGVNVPMAYTAAYTCFGLSCIVSAPTSRTTGARVAPFRVTGPEGCVLNAPYPAPVCSRHIIGQMLPDVVFGALTQAVPERVTRRGGGVPVERHHARRERPRCEPDQWRPVRGHRGMQRRHRRAARQGRTLCHRVSERGFEARRSRSTSRSRRWCSGARSCAPAPAATGAGAAASARSSRSSRPSARTSSCSPSFDRILHPPRGRYGGHDGERGGVRLASGAVLNGKGTQHIPAGERLILHTPGGAGFGDPHERDPLAVAADVAAGRISREIAEAVYGVGGAAG